MTKDDQAYLAVPNELIESIAERVAIKVMARLQPLLEKREPAPLLNNEAARYPPTFLRLKDLVDRLGVSRGTVYRWMSEGRFPQSVSLGGRSVAWRRIDVAEGRIE